MSVNCFSVKIKYSRIRHNIALSCIGCLIYRPTDFTRSAVIYHYRIPIQITYTSAAKHLFQLCIQFRQKRSLSRLSFTVNILIISTVLKLTVPTVRLCFIPVVTSFHYYNIFIITIYKCIEFIHNIINRNRLSVIRIIRNTDYVKINICKRINKGLSSAQKFTAVVTVKNDFTFR